jgi:hypothetical protein
MHLLTVNAAPNSEQEKIAVQIAQCCLCLYVPGCRAASSQTSALEAYIENVPLRVTRHACKSRAVYPKSCFFILHPKTAAQIQSKLIKIGQCGPTVYLVPFISPAPGAILYQHMLSSVHATWRSLHVARGRCA